MFPDENHLIFQTTVSGQPRRYDPLVVRRAVLRAAKGKLGDILHAAADPAPGEEDSPGRLMARLDAEEQIARVYREAFNLPAVDQAGGVPEEEVLRIRFEWAEWLKKKGESTRTPPTSSLPAAGGPPAMTSSSD